jgi:diguanylate cyclase (GGDEF)-like protein
MTESSSSSNAHVAPILVRIAGDRDRKPVGHDPIRSGRTPMRSGRDRSTASASRSETAEARLQTAIERCDQVAEFRDRVEEARDALDRLSCLADDVSASREHLLARSASADRAGAAEDRARASVDRAAAAHERAEALRDRAEFAYRLNLVAIDELTGARTRGFGRDELSREFERAHREGTSLVLAFIDVDGLKKVNDAGGHSAGDALLQRVGESLRAGFRPYDVIVRFGGDEFIVGMPNLSVDAARARVEEVAEALARDDPLHSSIAFGLAAAPPAKTLQELIECADVDLLKTRRTRAR